MTSREVYNYLKVEGIDKLYKKFEKYFTEVDTWADRFATGDLLNEYELSQALDRLTGIYMRFHIIAEAIDSYKTNQELNFKVTAFKEAEANGKKPTISQIEEEARNSTKDLRTYRSDFLSYSDACEKGIISTQARLKRQTVTKSALGVDFCGDVNAPAAQVHRQEEKKDVSWNE
jgi:hypothetical protein